MEFGKTYESFMNYMLNCKKVIQKTFFKKEDTANLRYENESEITQIVRNHRLKMIDIKLEHTMRMIVQIIKINEKLGLKIDMNLVIKIAVLYHDIGRFRQSIWTNSFSDRTYELNNKPFRNHGEDGYDIFINNDFNVDKKYVPVIGQTILHHVDYKKEPRLGFKYEDNLGNININDLITGKNELNTVEWQIASLIVQLVVDVDKADILYQHLLDDFDMIREFVNDYSRDSLDNIVKYWSVSKKEIIEYNKIDEISYEPKVIKIPIANMPIEKLAVPDYMKEMFYTNSWPSLSELIKDKHWNFICIIWWRLSHFLNELTFTSTLINIEESNLLEQIYEKIPERLKPLVSEAFDYAKTVFVEERLQNNKGNIYLNQSFIK